MKKRALYTDTFREIKKSLNRFLSIMMIVFLGVGFFVGIKATAPSMRATAEKYFNDTSLMDIQILSTTGFEKDDVLAISETDGVSKVMPSYRTDLILKTDTGSLVARVSSVPGGDPVFDTINDLTLLEGRMPEAENECLVSMLSFSKRNFDVGDIITFDETAGSTSTDGILANRTFKVVGIVESPQYISFNYGSSSVGNGTVSLYAFIPASNFLYPRFTELYVTLDCHSDGITAFDPEYEDEIGRVSSSLELIGAERYEILKETIDREIEEAENELDEKKAEISAQLADAKARLDEAKAELDKAEREIAEGWEEYENKGIEAEQQLQNARNEIESSSKRIAEGKTLVAQGQKEYEAALAKFNSEIASARAALDAGWAEYNEKYAEYEPGLKKYEEGLKEYEKALAQYEEGRTEYNLGYNAYTRLAGNYKILVSELESLEYEVNSDGVVTPEEQQQLDDLRAEVAAAEQQVESTKDMLDEGKKQLDAAEDKLDAAKAELDEALKKLKEAEASLASARKELENREAEFASKKTQGQAELDAANNELQSKRREIAAAEAALARAKKDLAQAEIDLPETLARAKQDLEDAEKKLAEGKAEYEKSYDEYLRSRDEAVSALEDGQNRILGTKNSFEGIISGKWYIFDRGDVIENYSGFNSDAERIDAIASVFPVFFLMIASLVCLTTMSRMVDEQRTQMGIYKALGFSARDIAGKYMIYSAIACVAGSVLGQIVCLLFLPQSIFDAYSALYRLPPLTITVPWTMSVVSFLVALACTVFVAWLCCRRELRFKAASLMRPKAPKAGKRVFLERLPALWNKMSFSSKITVRNLFRFKTRLAMTTAGIAGCMALVVSGFGLQDAINPIIDMQYGGIYKYDIMMALAKNLTAQDSMSLKDELASDNRISVAMFMRSVTVSASSGSGSAKEVYLTVPDSTADLAGMVSLRDIDTKKPLELSDSGVIISGKLADILDIGAGDSIDFTVNGSGYSLPVDAVSENYVFHYIYMSEAVYKTTFDSDAQYNTVVATAGEELTDFDSFTSDWLNKDFGIVSVFDISKAKQAFSDTIASLNVVVVIMLLSAGALAFVVIYNLTNINISERLREIATVKVLGFTNRETNMYIFRENVIMGIAGIIVGSVAGYFLAQYMITTLEVDIVMFYRQIDTTSYLFAALLTAFYIGFANVVMSGRIKRISMVESLKAVE